MRVAVIGAGAIGAVIADAALRSGHEVWVCSRSPVPALVLERDGQPRTLPLHITDSVERLPPGKAGVIWVTTKATDTATAAPWLETLCGTETLVAVAQNGLDHVDRLAPWVPAAQVAPVLAYIAAERLESGRVRHISGNRLVVPEMSMTGSATPSRKGEWRSRASRDMTTASWRKLLGNIVSNPITALTRRRIGVMREPGIADMARGLLGEAVAVGIAEGACLSEADVEAVLAGATSYGDATGSSMLYDLLAGRPLEHQYLTGEVVRRGRAHGLAVPLNAAVLALLDALDPGRRAPGA